MVHIYFLKKPNRAHWVWECIVVKAYRAAYRKCGWRCNCVLTSKSPNAALLYKEFCRLPFNSTSTLVGHSFTLLISSWFNRVAKFQIQRVKWNSSSAQLNVRDIQKWNACTCGTILHLTSLAGLQLQVAFLQLLLCLGQRGLQLLHLGLQGGLHTHQLSPLSFHRCSAVMKGLATRNFK